jgi:PTS system nitrogen regulatory IIA component
MKLYSLLDENHMLIGKPADNLEQAIRILLATFGSPLNENRIGELVPELMEREIRNPTMMAKGACMPHSRLEWLDRSLFGLFIPEIPFSHPVEDLHKVNMVFIILTPQNRNTMMIQTMAAIVRLLRSKEIRRGLINIKSRPRGLRLIEESGVDVKKTLVAADVMSPVLHSVPGDMNLFSALDVLVDAPDEGVPVLNENMRLIGELTSRELLTLGMPKYLDMIVNPSMLDQFEPFEAFFRHENSMKVREICRRDIVSVTPDTPIVQVAHLMMTRGKRRIYVVNDEQVHGVILRKSIVAKVLHY